MKRANTEWETPQDFFDKLNSEFHFTLDPCANHHNAKCEIYFTKHNDGLKKDWWYWVGNKKGYHRVFMNPPYDKSINLWLKKAYESSQVGSTVVCLIQGRSSDTKWWHEYVMRASEIRYIKDRLHFGMNKKFSRANISSIVVVFRPYCQGPPKTFPINTKGEKINEKANI